MNFMVSLKNIKKIGCQLVCSAYVEDSAEPMSISLDLKNGDFNHSPLPEGYEHCTMHVYKAKRALAKMAESGEIKPSWNIVWY